MTLVTIALVLHVLAATFWAGSTFTLARAGDKSAAQLFGPQMGAALVTVLAGAYVWARALGAGAPVVLGVGALAALVAVAVQGIGVGGVRAKIASDPAARARAALAHRVAAGLLIVTIACMVIQ
jgi:hypothetical protein